MSDILTADIGATNSRFAHFEVRGQELGLVQSVWLPTQAASSFAELLAQLKGSGLALEPAQAAAIALGLPGPVLGGVYCQPPYIAWDVDLARDRGLLGPGPVLLLNDFAAQAYACRSPIMAQAQPVLPGEVDYSAALAVIGAGSNLGHAALLPDGRGGHRALASEYGHAAFAFAGGREAEYQRFLAGKTGDTAPSGDAVVSGRGLRHLHWFLTGQDLEPAVVAAGLGQDSETLRWMAGFYGRACRQWALAVLALGGVYVAGGLAARAPALVTHPEFGREFRQGGGLSRLLERTPVFLNRNQESGLWGAAQAALETLATSG
ncbi:MAG: glucokinase [Desulfarculus sp.]|nr:MAG: glucokinase [Desulfarculus sp.]